MALILLMISACVAAFVLALVSTLIRRRSGGLLLFILVLLFSIFLEIFEFSALSSPAKWPRWKYAALLVESFLPACWLGFCLLFYREGYKRLQLWQWLLFLPAVSYLAVNAFSPVDRLFFSPDFADEKLLFVSYYGLFFYITLSLYLTLALVNLEKTFFAYPRYERWQVKFEFIGIGAILVASLLYYSQALLYRSLDMSLVPLRTTGLLVGCLLILFSQLKRGGGHRVRLSRDLTYRSIVVIAIGFYFLVLGLLGKGMLYLGGGSQKLLFVLVAFLLGVVFVVFLLSENIRRKAIVLLHKAFFAEKYDYRIHWKSLTDELGRVRSVDEVRSVILKTFCETFAMQAGALFWQHREGGAFELSGHYHLPWRHGSFAYDSDLVGRLAQGDRILDVAADGAGTLPHFEEEKIVFVIPLVFEQQLRGVILLGRRINPGETMTYEDFDLMKMLASQAVATLLNWHLVDEVVAHKEMAAMGKVTTFVMHDLKNTVSNLALAVENGRHYLDDPEFQQDMLETLDKSVERMKGLIDRLKNLEGMKSLATERVDLLELALRLVHEMSVKGIRVTGDPVFCQADPIELAKVIENLILNALDASQGEGPVELEVGQDGMAYLRCRDDGCGMPESFLRDRLFKPFETTKKKGFGIGLYQCRNIVEAHGGRIEVESQEGGGATFTVWLPGCDLAE